MIYYDKDEDRDISLSTPLFEEYIEVFPINGSDKVSYNALISCQTK